MKKFQNINLILFLQLRVENHPKNHPIKNESSYLQFLIELRKYEKKKRKKIHLQYPSIIRKIHARVSITNVATKAQNGCIATRQIFAFIFIFHNFHEKERRLINQNKFEKITKKLFGSISMEIFALRGSVWRRKSFESFETNRLSKSSFRFF